MAKKEVESNTSEGDEPAEVTPSAGTETAAPAVEDAKVVVPRKRVRKKKVVAETPAEESPEAPPSESAAPAEVLPDEPAAAENSEKAVAPDETASEAPVANTNNNSNNRRSGGSFNRRKNGKSRRDQNKNQRQSALPTDDQPRITINDLSVMTMPSLRKFAEDMELVRDDLITLKKQEIIFAILKAHIEHKNGVIFAYGALEILPDGYGFLRSPQNSYLPGGDDIYISPSQIRLFNLKTGDTVYGQIRSPKEGERFFAMLRVVSVNFDETSVAQTRISFENLTPLYPKQRLNMETKVPDPSTRMINLFCPIGMGQRGLIVSPPRSGKTVILQKIANCHYRESSGRATDCPAD